MVRECDRARIDVSNIPSDKVSVLHLKINQRKSPKLPSVSSVSECVNG